MKSSKIILMIIVLIGTISSCSKPTDEEIISKNVKNFVETMYTGDMDKAMNYCTEPAVASLEFLKTFINEDIKLIMETSNPSAEIISIDINEEKTEAEVACMLKNVFDLSSMAVIEETSTWFTLIKVEGKWLID